MNKFTLSFFALISIALVFSGCGRPNGTTMPVITGLSISPNPVSPNGAMTAAVGVSDQDGDQLHCLWTASQGWTVTGYGTTATVVAPPASNAGGEVTVTVSDGNGNSVSGTINVATTGVNGSPGSYISSIYVSPNPMNLPLGGNNQTATAIVTVASSNQSAVNFTSAWSITSTTLGWTITGTGSTATIRAPLVSNSSALVTVIVYDSTNIISSSSTNVFTGLMESSYPAGTNPVGVAIDASGNAWISDGVLPTANYVLKLNAHGTQQGSYLVGSTPIGMAIDVSGNIWIVNSASNDVTELDVSGNLMSTVTVGNTPEGIAIDASGQVWVTNEIDSTVSVFSSTTGNWITTVSLGSYTDPVGIAMDGSGNAWVANSGSSTVSEVNTTGVMNTYSVSTPPYAIAIDPSGNLWVTNGFMNSVTELSMTGTTITTVTGLSNPGCIAIDSGGNIWITNSSGNTITELNPAGQLIDIYTIGTNQSPEGLAIDASGNIWVADYRSNTVTEIFGVAQGPQYFPYTGPQFPGGGNIAFMPVM